MMFLLWMVIVNTVVITAILIITCCDKSAVPEKKTVYFILPLALAVSWYLVYDLSQTTGPQYALHFPHQEPPPNWTLIK